MMQARNLHDPAPSDTWSQDPIDDPFPGVLKGRSVRRKWIILGTIVLGVAVCGGVIGALSGQPSENQQRSPVGTGPTADTPTAPTVPPPGPGPTMPTPSNPSNTANPDDPAVQTPGTSGTAAPTTWIYTYLKSIVPDGGFGFDFFPESYQFQALQYVVDVCADCTQDQVRQRYALACIYYSTNAVRSAYTDYEIGVGQDIFPWHNNENWLTDDECNWAGITCSSNGLVEAIDLHDNFLTGKFPGEIVLLKDSLTHLDLESNLVYNADQELDWLGQLTNLRTLNVAQTPFEYVGIPTGIGRLTNLVHLDVSYSLFFGPLQPEVFQNLNQVQYLYIGGNSYNSSIPTSVAEMQNLLYLYAEYSDIEGDLSFLKSGMSKIFEFWADKNPKLTGSIPEEIGDLITLESLSLTNCGLTGPIPDEIGNLYRMQQMWLFGNQLEGDIPASIGNLTRMYRFEVENNQLQGDMPDEICDLFPPGGLLETLEADCDAKITNCPCCTCCGAQCAVQPSHSSSIPPDGTRRERRLNFVTEQRRRRRLAQTELAEHV